MALVNFVVLFLMALFVFDVPLKGSFPTLVLGALLYVTTTTGYGMLISSFTRTQIAALFGTAILTVMPATQFSGMLTPVSSLSGAGAVIGQMFPMTYFLKISVGTFTKGLGLPRPRHQSCRLGGFYSGADPAEPALPAQAGTVAGPTVMRRTTANIFWLGTKELRAFSHDFVLVALVDLGVFVLDHQHRAEQTSRSCTTPRSESSTRTIRSCRAASPGRSCRHISKRRGRSPNATSTP